MLGDELIQKNLFGNDTNLEIKNNQTFEAKDLTNEALTKDSKERPRKRKKNKLDLNSTKDNPSNLDDGNSVLDRSHSIKTVDKSKLSPVLKHYVNLKEENSNHFLLYRLGDFFECFFEDAINISQILEITLTSKDGGKGIGKVPMAGIPHHALDRYCSELIKKNFSVVICDQLEKSNGDYTTPIKRAITRIITPGTIIEEGMLVAKKNNWITAVYIEEGKNINEINWGISRADVSTGELITLQGNLIHKLCDEIIKLDVSEIIVGSEEEKNFLTNQNKYIKCTITQKTFSFALGIIDILSTIPDLLPITRFAIT